MSALEELVVSRAELDRELVATILKDFILIDRDSATIVPHEAWDSLGAQGKVLVYLIARKAMKALKLPVDREDCMPADIENNTGLGGGTVRSALKRLSDRRLVARGPDGRYSVPNWALHRAKAALARRMEA